jgi:hypothetical protein
MKKIADLNQSSPSRNRLLDGHHSGSELFASVG